MAVAAAPRVSGVRLGRWPVIGALGLLAAPVPMIQAAHASGFAVGPMFDAFVAWSFIGSGLVALRRRPESGIGKLMIAFGCARALAWLLIQTGRAGPETLGIIVQDASPILFVAVLLAFPDGRLDTRGDRWLLALVAFPLVPLELVWLAFFPADGPGNVLAIWPDAGVADAIDAAQRLLLGGAELVLLVVLAVRWLRASPPVRRALIPVVAGGIAILCFTLFLLYDRFVAPAPEEFGWAVAIVYTAVPIALLVVSLRARLARSAVGGLLVELSSEDGDLPAAVGRALGDPSLTIAYWVGDLGTYVDRHGHPVDPGGDADEPGRATSIVERNGVAVAVLRHDAWLRDEPDRLAEVNAAAAFALDNARLEAELRARVVELRQSRARVLNAADDERRRLERDLHDGAQKRLVTLSMDLGRLQARLGDDAQSTELLDRARQDVKDSLAELRELAHGIHPAVLTAHGLEIALESLAAEAHMPVQLNCAVSGRLAPELEAAAYYLVSEALTNMAKHAHAAHATVLAERRQGCLVVEVVDDGVGGANELGGGIRGLADRVESLDGRLRVWSPRGGGTRVRAEIPCA